MFVGVRFGGGGGVGKGLCPNMATFALGHHVMAAFWPVGPEWAMWQGMEIGFGMARESYHVHSSS